MKLRVEILNAAATVYQTEEIEITQETLDAIDTWYTIVRRNGEFLRAFAGGREFSGLGVFDTQVEFDDWINE